ncbi:MAG: hypothetical protein HQL95_00920 [Magnetococcales bacterium]|nr:hypothetical protein [Magnetococcales bacterium]
MSWNNEVNVYLASTGAEEIVLGRKESRGLEDIERLNGILEKGYNTNKNYTMLLFSVLTVLLAIYLWVVLFSDKILTKILFSLGGFGGIMIFFTQYRKIIREKFEMDFLLIAVREWQPKDVMRLLLQIKYSRRKK